MSRLGVLAAEKFWILDPLYSALGQLLAWFYAVIPSFGVAIILLTIAVSIVRMPLVAKQVKSQREMQLIQPELKRIQAKYKNEPQKRNEELMKLYKEHGVNPLAGCLPMVLQMPIFIVLYRLIRGLGQAEPKHLPTNSDLYGALREHGGRMRSFGMDLAESASKVHGFGKLLPYLILITLVVASGIYQGRQMTARLPKNAVNPQLAVMSKVFPIFLGFFSFSMPGGVVLYFVISNIWQIGQQAFLFSRQQQPTPGGKGSGGGDVIEAGTAKGKGAGTDREPDSAPTPAPRGFFARLAQAAAGAADDASGSPGRARGGKADGGGKPPAGGGRSEGGKSNGRGGRATAPDRKPAGGGRRNNPAGTGGGRGNAAPGGRPSPNGRATPKGGSGRAQPKGQPSPRSKPRNTRKGK